MRRLRACAHAVLCPDCAQYKLNQRTVGWEQYNKKLEQYNILVKARNFLVFQVGAGSRCTVALADGRDAHRLRLGLQVSLLQSAFPPSYLTQVRYCRLDPAMWRAGRRARRTSRQLAQRPAQLTRLHRHPPAHVPPCRGTLRTWRRCSRAT